MTIGSKTAGGLAIGAAVFLSGCATLVPELKTNRLVVAPEKATSDMGEALAYNRDVALTFSKLQLDHASLQAALNVGALATGIVGAKRVIYNKPVEALRPVVVTLAALGGLEFTVSPQRRLEILDEGAAALSCAKKVALLMDDLPVAVTNAPPRVPGASFLSSIDAPRAGIAIPIVAGSLAASRSSSSSALRAYSSALKRTSVPIPAARGVYVHAPANAVLAAAVDNAAANQDDAAAATAAKAAAARMSAPLFLTSSTEAVLRIVLTKLHQSSPTVKDIGSEVRSRSVTELKEFQKALEDANKKAQASAATVNATEQAAGSTTTTVVDTPPPGQEESPPEEVEVAPGSGGEAPRVNAPLPRRSQRPSPRYYREAYRFPVPQAAAAAATATADANASQIAGGAQQAAAAVQEEQSRITLLKELIEKGTQCAELKP
jgi:hypothetical protein